MSSSGKVWRRSASSGEWTEVFAPLDQQAEWREANRVVGAVADALSRQLAVGDDHWAKYQELCRAGAARPDRLFITFGIWQDGPRRWVTADFVQNQGLDSVVELDETIWRKLRENPSPAVDANAMNGYLWDFGIAWLPAYSHETWAGNAVISSTHIAGQVAHPAVLEDLTRLHEALLGDAAVRRKQAQALPRGLNIWLYSENEEHGIPVPREVTGLLSAKFALAAAASATGGTRDGAEPDPAPSMATEPEAMKLLPQFLKDRLAEQKKVRESGQGESTKTAVLERRDIPALKTPAVPVARSRPLFEEPAAARTLPVEESLAAIPVRPVAEPEVAPAPAAAAKPAERGSERKVQPAPPAPSPDTDLRELFAAQQRLEQGGQEVPVAASGPKRGRWIAIAAGVALLAGFGGAAVYWRPWESKATPAPKAVNAPVPGAARTESPASTATTPAALFAAPELGANTKTADEKPRKDSRSEGTAAPTGAVVEESRAARTGGRNRNPAKFEVGVAEEADGEAARAAAAKEEARRKAALTALTGQQ